MKKFLLTLGMVFTLLTTDLPLYAWEPIGNSISLSLVDIKPNNGYPRTPVYIPQVGQEGYTLHFHDAVDFTVNLYSVDEDGERTMEYTTFVPATTESITLPSNLTGTFVIEVVRGSQHFEGEIEL